MTNCVKPPLLDGGDTGLNLTKPPRRLHKLFKKVRCCETLFIVRLPSVMGNTPCYKKMSQETFRRIRKIHTFKDTLVLIVIIYCNVALFQQSSSSETMKLLQSVKKVCIYLQIQFKSQMFQINAHIY